MVRHRLHGALGVALFAGKACSSHAATVNAPSTNERSPTAASVTAAPAGPPSATPARWVPRVSTPAEMPVELAPLHGPAENIFGTGATTYLAKDRVGMLAGGRRFVVDHGALTAVDGEAANSKLELITLVPAALGGGIVFVAADAIYSATTFDGALVRLAALSAPQNKTAFTVGPHSVLVDAEHLVSLGDGKPVKVPAPNIGQMIVHAKSGFAILSSTSATPNAPVKSWITTDGKTFKPIALDRIRQSCPDGDALLVQTEKGLFRITRDGRVAPSRLSEREMIALALKDRYAPTPFPALDDGYPGALIDSGFMPTGRAPDEWYGVRGRQIWRANIRTHEITAIGAPVRNADGEICGPRVLDGVAQISCFSPGKRLDMYSLDLTNGATSVVYSFEMKTGVATFIGTPANTYPRAMTIMAGCDGDASHGICVRDSNGTWRTFPLPTVPQTVASFPGEVVTLGSLPDGSLELLKVATSTRHVFSPAEVARVRAGIGDTASARGKTPDTINQGLLRTADGLRTFEGPSPFEPMTKLISYHIDYPFNPNAPATVTPVDGVVAVAGIHGLRLADGKLWETADGWTTWSPVEPPPTGVPADLAGAMCNDGGCVAGPWARLGWDH